MKLIVIYNPQAASGRAKKLLPEVEKYFEEKNIKADFLFTEARAHGRKLVADLNFADYDGLVSAGGDGTLFEVINGYYKNESEKRIPMGVLPTGTGNAFARDLDLKSTDWKRAIDIIASKNNKKIDVGYFKTKDEAYYFLNILGLGFVSDVSKTAHGLKVFGNFAYTLGVFYQLLFLNTHNLKIELDGEVLERENIFVEISNSQYTGTSFFMAPQAKLDDGKLDITLLNKLSRTGLIKIFPTIFDGSHIHQDGVESFKASKIRVETNIPKILTPDGELLGSTPIEVECLKQDVDFFWPAVEN